MLPLIFYETEEEYRSHFERIYCPAPITTFDGIVVVFKKSDFDHCMYESTQRNNIKDKFSKTRSERIDWIKATLQNPQAMFYQGWITKKRQYAPNRRVAVSWGSFVVIIQVLKSSEAQQTITRARFITAYLADPGTISKIQQSPRWWVG